MFKTVDAGHALDQRQLRIVKFKSPRPGAAVVGPIGKSAILNRVPFAAARHGSSVTIERNVAHPAVFRVAETDGQDAAVLRLVGQSEIRGHSQIFHSALLKATVLVTPDIAVGP